MAKKKKRKKKKSFNYKAIVIVVVAIIAVLFVSSKVVYKCDKCGKTTFGAGYEPNYWNDKVNDEQIICKICAEEEHKLEMSLGNKSIDDFKLDIEWLGSSKK